MTLTQQRYQIVIGLEVHAQLKTESKLFCSCSAKFGASPNANTCPICLGYPGVLPVLNAKAVEYAIKAGLALGCQIDLESKFDRKQYFYPDLPKAYQISQFDKPLCKDGKLNIGNKEIRILRIHMEEDAGKLVHAGAERLHGSDYSLVDLNRASTPLIEIVSMPDINSAEEAVAYVKELRKILLYLDVCDGNMQEGSLRCDINISLNKPNEAFGTRAEIKNVNSFRSISRAIEYEYKRQSELLDKGESIIQETRLFDENTGKTHSMRSKEDAHDYRYFPEPDLLPLKLDKQILENLQKSLPELPNQKKSRYILEFGLSEEAAQVLVDDFQTAIFFEQVLVNKVNPVKAANYLIGPIAAYLNEHKLEINETKLSPKLLAQMLSMIDSGRISDNIAKNEIIQDLLITGKDLEILIQEKSLEQITDSGAIREIIMQVLATNQKQLEQYKSGNEKIKGFFVGQVMKASAGKASPVIINELLEQILRGHSSC